MDADATYDRGLKARVEILRERFLYRDKVSRDVLNMRRGDFDLIDPGAFSEDRPRPIVANMIEVYGRHAAAALSPMPAIRCKAPAMGASDAARDRAATRTQVVNHYFKNARYQSQMQVGADQFFTFGLVVTEVMPDFDDKMPVPAIRDSLGVYPVWNHKGETIEVARVFSKKIVDLIAVYPEMGAELRSWAARRGSAGQDVEVTHHDDGKYITLMVGDCGDGLILSRMKNPIGRCLTVCTARPTVDGRIRGAFDDLVWVQLAKHEAQILMIEAAADAVEAPLAVPNDVGEIPMGPKAVIRSNTPEKIGRVPINVPSEAFGVIQHLKDEMSAGAIVPEAMSGAVDASVITGKGLQELTAGYSQQIAWAQSVLTAHYEQVAVICMKMDEALWGDEKKTIDGYHEGSQYSLTYTPSKDIKGYYAVDVSYGTSTGLDPNRHLIFILQQLGAGMMSLDTAIREMPGELNADQELTKIMREQARGALMSSIGGLAQAIPQMAMEGGDPGPIVAKMAALVSGLEKGKRIEDLAVELFPEQQEQAQPQQQPGAGGPEEMLAQLMGGGGGAPAGPEGGGGAPQPPEDGGRPPVQQFFAGLTSAGNPNLGGYVNRTQPAVQ